MSDQTTVHHLASYGNHAKTHSKEQSSTLNTRYDIKQIFMRLASVYGHAWNALFPTQQALNIAMNEWFNSLNTFKLQDLQKGFERCKQERTLPPNLPQFIEYCQPDYGLPDVHTAYREAAHGVYPGTNHKWSHPAVYQAAKHVGFNDMRQKPEHHTRSLFEHIYKTLCRRVKNGEKLDKPVPLALTEGTSGKSGPKLARECLGGIYKILKTAPPEHSLIYNKMKGEE